MSATNSTTNYSLPIFIGTDKPAWLTDWNGAMNSIDTAIKGVSTSQEGTATSLSTLSTTVENLGTTVSGHTTSIQTLSNSVSTNTGSINTINSLIGNGTPTTTDQTIIGAINEINAKVGQTVEADDVTYDNTTSGLTATNVQSAIDEVKGLIPSVVTPDAEDVSYDNTTSGLSATNVQGAIDEIASAGGATRTLLWSNNDATTNFASQTVTLSSSDYDVLEIVCATGTDASYYITRSVPKGLSLVFDFARAAGNGAACHNRLFSYVSDTSLSVLDCNGAVGTTATSVDNSYLIPAYIYGIKY